MGRRKGADPLLTRWSTRGERSRRGSSLLEPPSSLFPTAALPAQSLNPNPLVFHSSCSSLARYRRPLGAPARRSPHRGTVRTKGAWAPPRLKALSLAVSRSGPDATLLPIEEVAPFTRGSGWTGGLGSLSPQTGGAARGTHEKGFGTFRVERPSEDFSGG